MPVLNSLTVYKNGPKDFQHLSKAHSQSPKSRVKLLVTESERKRTLTATYIGRKLHRQVSHLFLGRLQLSSQLADLLQTNVKSGLRCKTNCSSVITAKVSKILIWI